MPNDSNIYPQSVPSQSVPPQPVRRLRLPVTPVRATYILIAVNVAVFALQLLWGDIVMDYGALIPGAVIYFHQWWRLLTSGFLHGDILHIAMNLYALHSLGQLTERFFGWQRFVMIYAVSLLGTSVLVTMFSRFNTTTVGASGAVMGVLGALLFFFRRYRDVLVSGSHFSKELMRMAVLNIGIGLLPGISLWGHVGGFVAGLLMGWALCPHYEVDEYSAQLQHAPLSRQMLLAAILMPVGWLSLLGIRIILAGRVG